MPELTRDQIRDDLRALGLGPGDIVMAHTSLSSIGRVRGGAGALIDALIDAVAPGGTVVMPVLPDIYQAFDPETSASTVGSVSEAFRRRPGAVRSLHPSHSVAAIGPAAEVLTRGHEDVEPTGVDSPYERLARLGGWVLLLGVDQDRNTTLHLAETLAGVPYLRAMELRVLGPDGVERSVHVPKVAYGHREFIGVDRRLRRAGRVRVGMVGAAVARLMRVRDLVDFTVALLHKDPAALLCTKPRCIFCGWARAQIAAAAGVPDTTDWSELTRRTGCGDPHCECCVV